MTRLRVATLAGDPEREARLAAALLERRDVELVMRCVDRVELVAAVRGGALDAVVAAGLPVWLDARSVRECAERSVRVVALAIDIDEADRVAGLGLSMLPAATDLDSIVELCSKTEAEPELPGTVAPFGKRIAIWGPKGSPGRTTVAIELAAELAASGAETLIVDADPYGGDVLDLLGIVDDLPMLVWAAHLAATGKLDRETMTAELRRAFPAGPVVLPGLPSASLASDVTELGIRSLLDVSGGQFDYVVTDVGFCLEGGEEITGRGRNAIATTTVEVADRVVAVCSGDALGLKNFVAAWPDLMSLTGPERTLVAVNRTTSGDERTVREVLRRRLGVRVAATLPHATSLNHAVSSGRCLREREATHPFCRAIGDLAAVLGASVPPRGFLSRLAGRS